MFRRILVATDFSEASQSAIQTVLAFKQKIPAKITVLHVDTRIHVHSPHRDCACHDQLILEMKRSLPAGKIGDIEFDIVKGVSPAVEILDYSKKHKCDLIAIGSHHRNRIGDFLLGTAARQVIHESTCPVLAVHEFSLADRISFVPRRILIPTDFSYAASLAVQLGEQMAKVFGAQIHFIHVLELPALESIHSEHWIQQLNLPDSTGPKVDAILETLSGKTLTKIPTTLKTLQGKPSEEILAYATEQDMDIIVMGTHKSGTLQRLLIGSVTSTVVASAPCPVITVSPSTVL